MFLYFLFCCSFFRYFVIVSDFVFIVCLFFVVRVLNIFWCRYFWCFFYISLFVYFLFKSSQVFKNALFLCGFHQTSVNLLVLLKKCFKKALLNVLYRYRTLLQCYKYLAVSWFRIRASNFELISACDNKQFHQLRCRLSHKTAVVQPASHVICSHFLPYSNILESIRW